MSKDAENSGYGVIPEGTWIKLFEGSVITLQDVAIKADQAWIDQAIIDENNYRNGIGVVGDAPVQLAAGAMSAMHVSASIGKGEIDSESIQKAIRDAAKTLNVAYNAKFINRVEWRTETIDRLLSSVHIKSVDEAIVECQKVEKYVFGENEIPKDIDPLASWYL
ncbi:MULTISPECIES: hypothetical protein [Acinetobacter]|uniref:hypothetical protein n=1 Tax=Acinetobacter TaxID=469 RepID=UPI001F3B6915|nr:MULTISPECIES: hypothetical protein [Acinetobacter]MDV2483313.1 hypothetical protein [Acinetobacter towneri]UIZ56321.1 hypothetical protein LZP46_07740 [Acinetobacter sp. SCLZS86]